MKKIKDKKLAISVGTTAYNESLSIEKMLRSVIAQKGKNITIKEIIVISDGSTDDTVSLVKKIPDRRIKIIDENERLGQPARIRQLLRIFRGAVLVVLDADMVIKKKNTLQEFVSGFLYDNKIGLIGANTTPLPPRTFIESAINNYIYARASLYGKYNTENCAYSVHGCMAFSRKFGKSLRIPTEILSTDSFSYFSCISKGYKFLFAKQATIYYRSPQNIKDHISQSTRHLVGGIQLNKYFDQEIINKGFRLPKMVLVKISLYQLSKNPFAYILLKALNTYCCYKSKMIADKAEVKWGTIATSKNLAVGINRAVN